MIRTLDEVIGICDQLAANGKPIGLFPPDYATRRTFAALARRGYLEPASAPLSTDYLRPSTSGRELIIGLYASIEAYNRRRYQEATSSRSRPSLLAERLANG